MIVDLWLLASDSQFGLVLRKVKRLTTMEISSPYDNRLWWAVSKRLPRKENTFPLGNRLPA
jgi:hypothetical protein